MALPHPDVDVTEIVRKLGPMPERIIEQIQGVIRDHYRAHPEQLDALLQNARLNHPKAS